MDGLRVEEEEGFLSVGTGLRVWRICCRLGRLEHGFIHFQHACLRSNLFGPRLSRRS
jgi:hypothetical protein